MTTIEFFKHLLEEGSIEALIEKYPELTYKDVNRYFESVFDKFSEPLSDDIYELYSDGASKGNPGHAGIGFVIKKDGYVIDEKSRYIGTTTNNVAEYTAFIEGLARLQELGIKKVNAFSDSELLVKQINGEYSIKDAKLKKLYSKAKSIINLFDLFSLKHIPREKNKLADKLSQSSSISYST